MSHNKHVINTATGQCKVCMLTTTTGFTRECLGKPMHSLTVKAVSKGEIDYYDGKFHSKTEAKEETLSDILKGIADKHGFKLVEVHSPRMQRANTDGLEAYEAMEKFINDFMAQKQEPEEYALSKDKIEFLKQIHDHPIPRKLVNELRLSQSNFILLHSLKKAGYVYPSVDGSSWIITPKAEAYLKSLSKPATLVMTTDGIALLVILNEDSIDNDEVMSAETMPDAADLLVDLDLAHNCGEHLHITDKGRDHMNKLLNLTIG